MLNNNWDRLYYSDISQYVYIRNGQSSNKISFVDTLKLIAERSYPQVYANLGESQSGTNNKQFPIRIINKGVKSTKKINCFILIRYDEEIEIRPQNGYSTSLTQLDLTNFGLSDSISSCEYNKIFQYLSLTVRELIEFILLIITLAVL